MTPERIIAVVSDFDTLVKRAVEIVGDAPYWCYVHQPGFARLEISATTARLIWPQSVSDYDSCSIETETSKPFDIALLLMNDDEIKVWKKEQRDAYEMEKKRAAEVAAKQQAVAQEARERGLLAALKKKYGE